MAIFAGLTCDECHTAEHLTFLDDLVQDTECAGCNWVVCAECGHDAVEEK